MNIRGVGLTDIGYKRKHNEDAFFCDVPSGVFLVADGMGGQAAGETASKAVTTIFPIMLQDMLEPLQNPTPDIILTTLSKILCQLSHDLYQQSQEIPEVRGLGSTAALLVIRESRAYIAYAGDSRIYLLRDRQLMQVSEDQTIAAALVRTGHLTPKTAESSPLRNALEEYIGKEGELHPGVWQKTLQPGDRWLLCSDGLTKGVSDHELCELLLRYPSSEEACHMLVKTAKNTDGTDNITVIIVDIINSEDELLTIPKV
jgi:protein phosphatase